MRRWRILAILAALAVGLCASLALGQQASIDGPDSVPPYRFVDLSVVGDWESAVWEIEPADVADVRYSADGKTLTFIAPPGVYTVRAVLANFTAKKLSQAKRKVTIGTPGPQPDPTPGPTPDPIPTPGLTYQWLVFIESENLDNLPAGQQAIVASLTFRQRMAAKGHVFLGRMEPANAPPAYASLVAAIGKLLLPVVCLAPTSGGPVKAFPLPANEAAQEALLTKGGL
jgi:hypothetical protein